PPPPRPPPFPYTPLFRSGRAGSFLAPTRGGSVASDRPYRLEPTMRSRVFAATVLIAAAAIAQEPENPPPPNAAAGNGAFGNPSRSEEHTSELQSLRHLVC